ncbi:hypothetical protein [Candidatus Aalborgicola defluviihabitans]|uniref:hypothetical protein n=1 Tax=Candidatus Aalborgicola defluviihabitans TaxID=3386187 RepID=UPI00390C09BE|nr:hypothetical protein [Burkholderiales bacterium]
MTTLNQEEIQVAQAKINSLPNNIYKVKDIFGNDWESISDPHGYGRRFFQTVKKGLLTRIAYHHRGLDNHRSYSIHK